MKAATLSLALVALLAAACGSDERQFDAETAIGELNEAGAGLELGEELPSSEEGVELRTITFAAEDDAAAGAEGADDHAHGTVGAVVILADAAAAEAEFERCGTAVSFICFRAANAVLRFTDLNQAEQARVTTAVSALATDPS